ncbi:MAG: hypothetical protein AMS14_11035 [Planctomycetes bacterium DG_20]|nr:MAG: hypothetical protein AMS14_11035 [Planctomycetes bacterium DG_20]
MLGTLWGFNQRASANEVGPVSLVHLEPGGADYTGNPYCPDTDWSGGKNKPDVNPAHDCNNITSQNHVIRTEGFDPGTMARDVATGTNGWVLDGVGEILGTGPCGSLAEVTGRALWGDDDGDGLVDEDGDECANVVNDDPADDALVNDGCPTVGLTAETTCDDTTDDDGDGAVNDGCPVAGSAGEPVDNDGDTVLSEDPAGSVANDDEQCVIIHSTTPGEVRVTLAYSSSANGESGAQCANNVDDDGDGAVNDGCPGEPVETECADVESGTAECGDGSTPETTDDDSDGAVNDGCPAVGPAETVCGADTADDDADGYVNDGCPVVFQDDDGDTVVNDGCPADGDPEEGDECANAVDDDDDGKANDGCPGQIPETGDQCDDALDAGEDFVEDVPPADGFVNDGCPAVMSRSGTAWSTASSSRKTTSRRLPRSATSTLSPAPP